MDVSTQMIDLLNEAILRELQVSFQYMMQHAIWSIPKATSPVEDSKLVQFIGSHLSIWMPGTSLKKIAIPEMRHAEAIAERLITLGAQPPTQPDPFNLGENPKNIIEIDRDQETRAIKLYKQIVAAAQNNRDTITRTLFEKILRDEEKHYKVFSGFLE